MNFWVCSLTQLSFFSFPSTPQTKSLALFNFSCLQFFLNKELFWEGLHNLIRSKETPSLVIRIFCGLKNQLQLGGVELL